MPEQQDEWTRDQLTSMLATTRAERNQLQSDYQAAVINGEREIVLLRMSNDLLKKRMELINYRASINAHYFMDLEVGFVDSEREQDDRLAALEARVVALEPSADGIPFIP